MRSLDITLVWRWYLRPELWQGQGILRDETSDGAYRDVLFALTVRRPMTDCTQCLGLASCTVPSTNSNARLGHAVKAPHRAQEPGHRKEHQSKVRFGSCSMSVAVRNAWINKIPGVWVLEWCLEGWK